MDISKSITPRLGAVCSLLKPCRCAVDIGTDHAYVPIFLVLSGKCESAVACDISPSPLKAAKANIAASGVKGVTCRISDGFGAVAPFEVNGAIIAGMGGDLIVKILSHPTAQTMEQIVISPHRAQPLVRRFLHEVGFKIEAETLTREGSRFYSAFRAVRGSESKWSDIEYEVGRLIIEEKHPLLPSYAASKIKKLDRALAQMSVQSENYAPYMHLRKELEAFL